MTKKPANLAVNDTFVHAGTRYTVLSPVVANGDRTAVATSLGVLRIPSHIDLRIA